MKRIRSVDICIPTYRPGPELEHLLRCLAEQLYPIHQVRIVNTEEKYWNSGLDKAYPDCRVTHIAREEFDHGGTRHRMAEESQAEILIFMTQDALPADNNLVGKLVEAFDLEGVKAAYARQLPRPDCSLLERTARDFNYPPVSRVKGKEDLPKMGIKTFFCSNVCAAYDRKTYAALGGFPRQTIFNEDMIYAGRVIEAGYGIAYVAEALVVHSHNYSGRQQFHRNFDLAVSQADYPEIFAQFPSEGEGIRLVKQTALAACRKGRPWLLFPLFWQSACKYAGYFLGKRYRRLPGWLVARCTMNPSYWKKKEQEGQQRN